MNETNKPTDAERQRSESLSLTDDSFEVFAKGSEGTVRYGWHEGKICDLLEEVVIENHEEEELGGLIEAMFRRDGHCDIFYDAVRGVYFEGSTVYERPDPDASVNKLREGLARLRSAQ